MLDYLFITAVIFLITVWIQSRPFTWRGIGIQWSLPLPLIGNTGKLLIKSWKEFWQEYYSSIKDNKIYGFHYFSTPAILIKDPALLRKVLISDADYFLAREVDAGVTDPVGRSVFFTRGYTWKTQRSRMTPYFTPSRIKATLPYIHPITDKFVQYISKEGKKGPIDVQSISFKLSTEVIMSNAFGLQPDCFDNPNSYFFELQKEFLSFKVGLRAMINIMAPQIHKLLGLTLFEPSTIKKLTDFVNDVISQRSKGIGVRPDFMQGMIDLLDEDKAIDEGDATNDNNKISFDKKTVLGQCILMYVAGSETTGNTLSFVLYELALHQNIQDRLRDEIMTMIKKTSDQYGIEDLYKLKYMDQVISETLRKYPVVTVVGRKCTSPYNLDGINIPVGTIISVPIVAIHHDANFFPDPMKFNPERFSSDSTIVPGTYLPFGLGPKTCLGMKFALTELQLALCKLLPKFKLTPSYNTPIPLTFTSSPTISSRTPIWLHVEPIQ